MSSTQSFSKKMEELEKNLNRRNLEVEKLWDDSMELLQGSLKSSLQSAASTIRRDTDSLQNQYNASIDALEKTFERGCLKMESSCEQTIKSLQKTMKKERWASEIAHLRRWSTPILLWLLIVLVIPALSVLGMRWYWLQERSKIQKQISRSERALADMKLWGVTTAETEDGKFLVIPQGYDRWNNWSCEKQTCVKIRD